ncbi:MAG TPA: hypothetical protein VM324_01255 [Egibacteraceae bacterium]|jgi:hypothetical protein|nr:hypothetical protein [Egibacteraceae bacterium]
MIDFRVGDGRRRGWGPDDDWGAWFGSGVLRGLVEVIDCFLDEPMPFSARSGPARAALGCVPWLSHRDVTDRLSRMRTCVVVDKPDRATRWHRALQEAGEPFPPQALPGFDSYAPRSPEGEPVVVGPHGPWPPYETPGLGPVRVAGFRGDKTAPLLHAKVLVLGYTYWAEDEFSRELMLFRPRLVWWGSANWTRGAERHIEVGTYSDDGDLLDDATRFISDLVKISEPLDTTSSFPEPEFAEVDFDDAAFIEYLDEYGDCYEEEEADDARPSIDQSEEYGFLPEEADD